MVGWDSISWAGRSLVGEGIVTGIGFTYMGLKYASGGGRVEKGFTEASVVATEEGRRVEAVVVMFLRRWLRIVSFCVVSLICWRAFPKIDRELMMCMGIEAFPIFTCCCPLMGTIPETW